MIYKRFSKDHTDQSLKVWLTTTMTQTANKHQFNGWMTHPLSPSFVQYAYFID